MTSRPLLTRRPPPSRLLRKALLVLLAAPLVLGLAAGCRTQTDVYVAFEESVDAENGAVVCVEPHAAAIGATVLARGGTAVDAAVATALALAVTWPEAGNVGGGGFLLHRAADGTATFVDYRETAPAAATPDMFLRSDGSVDPVRVRLGFLPVGVPGTVAGLALAHERFGSLPWRELVAPARRLAAEGIVVDAALAASIAGAADELALCDEAARIFLRPDGSPLREGDRLVQRDLAETLGRLETEGPRAFYDGEIARRIAADSRARGGILTEADFASYRAVLREPLRGSYRGATVLAGPPPTSGGVVLLQALFQLEGFDLAALPPGGADELHLLGEALRRAFLDRARWLGDPDFVENPLDRLLDEEHVASLREGIDPARATPSDVLAGDLDGTLPPAEGGNTTHFSVVDRFGNAVANTTTLEESWGAKVVARGTGIVLNDEMHDFNVTPGRSTRDGRIGTAPNLIAPRKRMLSSMCPVIVERDGRLLLVAGSPGGRTIPSTVLRVVTAVVDHELPPRAAVDLPRVHHGLYPDRLDVEDAVPEGVRADLESRGHVIRVRERQGDAHVIAVDPASGRLSAAMDRRRAGAAATPLSR